MHTVCWRWLKRLTKKPRHKAASFVMLQWRKMSLLSARVYAFLWQKGNGMNDLAGIEAELRGIQHFDGANAAVSWWQRNYAHKYIDYKYDVISERIVRRE